VCPSMDRKVILFIVLLIYALSCIGIWSLLLSNGKSVPVYLRLETYAAAGIEVALMVGLGFSIYKLLEFERKIRHRRKLSEVDKLTYMLHVGAVISLLVLSALCYYCLAGLTGMLG